MPTVDEGSLANGAPGSDSQVDYISGWEVRPVDAIPANSYLLLSSLNLTPARLQTRSKVAISVRALRALLVLLVKNLPFDEVFYTKTYPDLADAFRKGVIPDLHQHFIEHGFFEGRFGSIPEVDEKFYRNTYPDIESAIGEHAITSALDHYVGAGAAEGRFPNEKEQEAWNIWLTRISDN